MVSFVVGHETCHIETSIEHLFNIVGKGPIN